MTTSRIHYVGQLQRPNERPENVELTVERRSPANLINNITDGDATPSVKTNESNELYKTANTSPTTITDFDDAFIGQIINVIIGDANTTVDFTGTNLKNDQGSDWSPSSGDYMRCVYDGSTWYCAPWDAAASGGSPFATALEILADANTATPPTTEFVEALLSFKDLANDDQIGYVGWTGGSNTMQLRSTMGGGKLLLGGTTTGDAFTYFAQFNPTGTHAVYGNSFLESFSFGPSSICSLRSTGNTTTETCALYLTQQNATRKGYIGYIGATDVLAIANDINGANLTISADTTGAAKVTGFTLDPDAGTVALGTFVFDIDQTVGAGQDNYVLTYDNAAGLISLETGGGGLSNVIEDATPQFDNDLNLITGADLYVWDGTDTDNARFHHDGIDFNTAFTTTADWNVTGANLNYTGAAAFSGAVTGSNLNVSNWDTAYNDKINSASFGTGDGIITLTQQDAGTVTVDIDGRYAPTASPTFTGTLTAATVNLSADITLDHDIDYRIENNAGTPVSLLSFLGAGDAVNLGDTGYGLGLLSDVRPDWYDGADTFNMFPGHSPITDDLNAHTFALGDVGETRRFTGASGTAAFTIPANTAVAFEVGDMIGIVNSDATYSVTIPITTDTLTWTKDNTTGTRTLAPGGMAVIMKVDTTKWVISGSVLLT